MNMYDLPDRFRVVVDKDHAVSMMGDPKNGTYVIRDEMYDEGTNDGWLNVGEIFLSEEQMKATICLYLKFKGIELKFLSGLLFEDKVLETGEWKNVEREQVDEQIIIRGRQKLSSR